MSGTEPTWSTAATPLAAREPWPDLARGAMLLLIALANVRVFLYGRPLGVRSYPVAGDLADRAVAVAQMLLVDGRAYPLFGLLVGYGLVRIARRAAADGAGPARTAGLLARRGAALLAIGALHGLLLFSGDIVGAYGLLALVLALPVATGNRFALGYLATAGLVVGALLGSGAGRPAPDGQTAAFASRAATDPLGALTLRAGEWLTVGLLGQALAVVAPVALGALAADRLDALAGDPARLRRVALIGLAVGVVGGAPLALAAGQFWAPSGAAAPAAAVAHQLSGLAAAVGYVALAALVARRAAGPVAAAVRACGQRSLTCYLAQSVVFVAVLAPFAGGFGARLGVADAALLAVATWAATVLAAWVTARAGHRGPAEVLLRRLTYGPR